ncbi:MAG: glycoside hydrolase family 125 protein [Porphyromonas sp.]|nr:glycoside hydrolase family 125 protein [Porphyromonas sp.]
MRPFGEVLRSTIAGVIIATTSFIAPHAIAQEHYTSQRPPLEERLFTSKAVEADIVRVQGLLTNPKLSWMFGNCLPNTIDTTVHFRIDEEGQPETFVYTGDIAAMWLRDSGAQVWPYLRYANIDPAIKQMIAGTVRMQLKQIIKDPFANAFIQEEVMGPWKDDLTDMKPGVHERKWEIDSHCYPIRLAHEYWKVTGDTSIFDDTFVTAMRLTLATFKDQQRKEGRGSYQFMRVTERSTDSKSNMGWGEPVNPVGLIVSSFRPSDDATHFQFLIPSNFFAVTSLRKAAEILTTVNDEPALAHEMLALADEVEQALREYAVYDHPKYGEIYAFEVDGYGNHNLMDDSNVPSLLALPYLGDVAVDDAIYQNTRRFVLSEDNPYFFRGTAGEGIGGPHIGYDMVWPMSIMMRAFTSQCDEEIAMCVKMLMDTDAGTGFMHESFHKDDPTNFTRSWFAWQNSLFGELILRLIDEGKLELLNNL